MTETTTFRRVAATLTIGSFSIAALMGIVALLGGGDFGEGEARVVLTTLIVGCASINVLCYLATAGTRFVAAGLLGAAVVVLPVVTALHLVWRDWDDVPEGELKVFGIGVVAALTLAQTCLLLALAGERPKLRPVLAATVALAGVVAFIVSGMIIGEIEADDVWRVLGVAGILDVLGTLVTIALAKFGGRAEPVHGPAQLTLSEAQAAELSALGRRTGRPAEQLLAEAVGQYLRRAQTTAGSGIE